MLPLHLNLGNSFSPISGIFLPNVDPNLSNCLIKNLCAVTMQGAAKSFVFQFLTRLSVAAATPLGVPAGASAACCHLIILVT